MNNLVVDDLITPFAIGDIKNPFIDDTIQKMQGGDVKTVIENGYKTIYIKGFPIHE